MPAPRLVAVIGKGRRCPPAVAERAAETGASLAALHPAVALVCGGLGGVMDAAARGITEAGGVAIGLLPDPAPCPSPHLSYAVRTGLPARARDLLVAESADLVFVLPGSHGTLIESWAAADRRVPLVRVGVHDGWPTEYLPYHTALTSPAEAAAVAAVLLELQR